MKNKKTIFLFFTILFLAEFFGFTKNSSAEELCANHIVISEIYGGGGNSGAVYKNDFIELYNPTDKTILLDNWTIQYASATSASFAKTDLKGEIKPGAYYLIQEKSGSGGTQDLPEPDASGNINLASDKGKVALVKKLSAISNKDYVEVIDFVGYGSMANEYETKHAPAPSNTKSIARNTACVDTDNNSADFGLFSPNPQNSFFAESLTKTEPEPVAYSDQILISEILPAPKTGEKEFVELYNADNVAINLKGWRLQDTNLEKKGKFCAISSDLFVASKKYIVFYLDECETSIILNNSDGDKLILFNPNKEPVSESVYMDNAPSGHAYAFDNTDWRWTSKPTPGNENEFDKINDDSSLKNPNASSISTHVSQILINEILPNPKGDEKIGEYVEIFNSGETAVDIGGWILKDKSSTNYIFPNNTIIEPEKFLIIYRSAFKFALNNSGYETVFLFDKTKALVSSVLYNGAKENISYNFDGAFWHWSKKLTPGEKNEFNNAPKIKLGKIKRAYVGVPIAFSGSVKDKDGDKLKYVWNFGNGRKSYLQNTTHTFLKKGTYKIVFTVDDGSDKFAKSMTVKVTNYPKSSVRIVALVPNPAGNDTGQEKISIINNSAKKINLRGWKIATGSKKTLINHPIRDDFFINPGQTIDLTRANAYFYLNNKAMRLELRYPNNKTADKVAYSKDKVSENEVYQKINGRWAWIKPEPENTSLAVETLNEADLVLASNESEIQNNLGKFSVNPAMRDKKNKTLLASHALGFNASKRPGLVLGASTVRPTENNYSFLPPTTLEKHWLTKIGESIFTRANSWINYWLLQN